MFPLLVETKKPLIFQHYILQFTSGRLLGF